MRTGGEAAAARRHGRVAERSSLVACSLTGQRCRLDGRGRGKVSGGRAGRVLMAGQQAAGQRRSEACAGRSSACAGQWRVSEGERERREKEEWREKRNVNALT